MLKKLSSWIWIILLIVWEVFLQPIWNLNVENLAIDKGVGAELGEAAKAADPSMIPVWLMDALTFLTGDFLWGAAFVGATYLFFDFVSSWKKKGMAVSAKPIRQLSSMYVDLSTVKDEVKRAVRNPPVNPRIRNVVGQTFPVAVVASLRSNFAQLRSYEVITPSISDSILLSEAEAFSEYIETILPFVGRSQVEELKEESSRYLKKIQQKSQ